MPLTRKNQLLVKQEVTEGVLETLAGADAIQVFELQIQDATDIQRRAPSGASLSRAFDPVGAETRTLSFETDFRGSGDTGTAPDFDRLLPAAGYKATALRQLTLGAVTGIGFQVGEVVQQTTANRGVVIAILNSGGTVLKHRTTTTGDLLIVAPVTGTLANAATTGESSASTSTTSGAAAFSTGYCYQPTSEKLVRLQTAAWVGTTPSAGDVLKVEDTVSGALIAAVQIQRDLGVSMVDFEAVLLLAQPGFNAAEATNRLRGPANGTTTLTADPIQTRTPSLTARTNLDGRNRAVAGGRLDMSMDGEARGAVRFRWTLSGDLQAGADALAVATTGLGTVRPPLLRNAICAYGLGAELHRVPTKRVGMDQANTVTVNPDANKPGGATGSLLTDRTPVLRATLDNINGAFDVELAKTNATPVRVAFIMGTTRGNIVGVVAPSCQVTEATIGDADGVSVFDATFEPKALLESGDDELYIFQL